jgi:hypothetical protein
MQRLTGDCARLIPHLTKTASTHGQPLTPDSPQIRLTVLGLYHFWFTRNDLCQQHPEKIADA